MKDRSLPWGGGGRRLLLAAVVLLLGVAALAGSAAANDEDLGESVVEVILPDRDAVDRLVATGTDIAHDYRVTDDGIVAQVVVNPDELADLQAQGFETGAVLFTPADHAARIAERAATIAAKLERNGIAMARRGGTASAAATDTITILRTDYFTSGGSQFISVEAKTNFVGTPNPTLTLRWDSGPGTPMGSGGTTTLSRYVDAGAYMYHLRQVTVTARPSLIEVTSTQGGTATAPTKNWLLPVTNPGTGVKLADFVDHYLVPTELYSRIEQLHDQFPQITQLIDLPYKTNGYQRKAQAALAANATTLQAATLAGASAIRVASQTGLAAGMRISVDSGANQERRTIATVVTPNPASPAPNVTLTSPLTLAHANAAPVFSGAVASGNSPATASQAAAVILTSRAFGHLGGNNVAVEIREPAAASSPLMVSAIGNDILVTLASNADGNLTSTAAQVNAAINADPAASALAKAVTYRGNAGAGIVQPRARVNLSDFLNAPASIPRGPNAVKMLRISGKLDGSNTGVFIYAQEHAREWVPPQITVEVAERLLRNYAIDTRTRQLVNQLDIFILPSVNPDGGTSSFFDFGSQRRNMTNHCVVGSKVGDDPMAANFWTPAINPFTGAAYTNNDPASRTGWGVDNNRNYGFGSIFDGYSGGSSSCTSDTYSGPSEVSEPEDKNVVWVADTFDNIKYSMNTHSSGNYFMWAPGAYKTDCGSPPVDCRELLPRPDAGTEAYFWAASETILSAIKQYRGFSVTPARTGPVADVLYSAAGNSGDHLYYLNDIYAWDFEVGTSFQPNWTEGHELTMEFANGMYGLLEVAWARDHDWKKPDSKLVIDSQAPGTTRFHLETNEPAMIFYTLDGSKPTPASPRYPVNGDREYGKFFDVTSKTTVSFYAVDPAGNIENGYVAGGNGVGGNRFNKVTVNVN